MSYNPTQAYFAASNAQEAARNAYERGNVLADTKQEKEAAAIRFENMNSANLMADTTSKVKAFLGMAKKAGSMVDARTAVNGIKNLKNSTADDAWAKSGLEADLNEAIRVTKANGFDTERAAPPPRKPATAGRRRKTRRTRRTRRRPSRKSTRGRRR
jgi:hypothetical protein